jgi:hypothetical protein
MSATDAAREMMTPLHIPDRFTLIIPTEQFNRPCHFAWRKDRRIGMTFE